MDRWHFRRLQGRRGKGLAEIEKSRAKAALLLLTCIDADVQLAGKQVDAQNTLHEEEMVGIQAVHPDAQQRSVQWRPPLTKMK